MSRSKNRKIADLISGGTFDDGIVAASEVSGLHSVASTGNFNELENKPAPFDPATLAGVAVSGSFNDLSDQPAPFDPSTLATVATTGAYSALSGKPSLGTASAQSSGTFATAAQGALAATALQSSSSLAAANLTGTLPAINGSALTGVGPSTTVGAVGTYAMLIRSTKNADITTGTTYAGSGLLYCGFLVYPSTTGNGYYSNRSGSPSGTWRAMGYNNGNPSGSTGGFYQGTIFLRIS